MHASTSKGPREVSKTGGRLHFVPSLPLFCRRPFKTRASRERQAKQGGRAAVLHWNEAWPFTCFAHLSQLGQKGQAFKTWPGEASKMGQVGSRALLGQRAAACLFCSPLPASPSLKGPPAKWVGGGTAGCTLLGQSTAVRLPFKTQLGEVKKMPKCMGSHASPRHQVFFAAGGDVTASSHKNPCIQASL